MKDQPPKKIINRNTVSPKNEDQKGGWRAYIFIKLNRRLQDEIRLGCVINSVPSQERTCSLCG